MSLKAQTHTRFLNLFSLRMIDFKVRDIYTHLVELAAGSSRSD